MKKLALLFFALLLTISVSAQQKKNFAGATAAAGLTKQETVEATAINKEKTTQIKAIRKQQLAKDVEKEKIKEVKKAASNKIKKIVGKEKFKAMNAYWKKK
ncbi:hypothetical protein GCM10022291_33210 [Postechiella marina]|uniref:DUF4890 domain-containing protein n=1 Tax=Postechiella marina TaxID=943941 RepID=A0ABP8CHV8_9FLAO